MTNGEKMISAFPNGEVRKVEKGVVFSIGGWCHAYAKEWWNAECEEPTTKNKFCPDRKAKTTNMETILHCIENDCVAYKDGKCLKYNSDQEPTTKNDLGVDCISREQALVVIRNLYPGMPRVDFNGSLRKWVDKYKPYIECDDAIKQLPSVTPQEPRKGHWITRPHIYGVAFCSECGFELKINNTNYCPNCRADMREVEE